MKKASQFIFLNDTLIRRSIILTGLLVFIYMAYKSTGYYHADEHYQIIEFAGEKLGTHSKEDMVWEYHERTRPTLQPTIAYCVVSILKSIGINSPFTQTFVFRLMTGLGAFLVLLYFSHSFSDEFKEPKSKNTLLFFSLFLWFIPFLSVRFSSETWSGLLFLFSIGFYYRSKNAPQKLILLGFTLGLSFLFRYQIAWSVLGFTLWLIFIEKVRFNSFLKLVLGFSVVSLAGFLLDIWFYGEITFVPWQFLSVVLETSGRAFGVEPWYFYVTELSSYPSYLLAIPIFITFIIAIRYHWKSPLIWSIVPFLIFHSFIPHKELRFLFPIAFMLPGILALGVDQISGHVKRPPSLKVLFLFAGLFFVLINLCALLLTSQKAAGNARTTIIALIANTYPDSTINLLHTPWLNPYNPWNSIEKKFYLNQTISYQPIKGINNLHDSLLNADEVNLLVTNLTPKNTNRLKAHHFFLVGQNIPTPVYQTIKNWQPKSKLKLIGLYEYKE